jgi:hypothetical protein
VPSITPVNIGLRSKAARMMSWVRALVRVIQHGTWRGCSAALPRKENTGGEIDAAPVDARRRAGLEPGDAQRQFAQARRQRQRGGVTGAAAGVVGQADVNLAAEKGADGEHHRGRGEAQAEPADHAGDAVALDDQVFGLLLEQGQPGLVLQRLAHRPFVEHAVGLGAGGAHRRALAGVEDTEMDAGAVGRMRHQAAERVDLLDQMALADAADGGIAGHLAQGLDVLGQQQGAASHARSRQRRLGAGMAAADDDDVKVLLIGHGTGLPGAG